MKPASPDLIDAWQRVESGRSTPEDGQAVVSHLARITGFYDVPSFDAWIEQHKSPAGFDLHCARQAAKREVFAAVLSALSIDAEAYRKKFSPTR